jgi:hypothetical protein
MSPENFIYVAGITRVEAAGSGRKGTWKLSTEFSQIDQLYENTPSPSTSAIADASIVKVDPIDVSPLITR